MEKRFYKATIIAEAVLLTLCFVVVKLLGAGENITEIFVDLFYLQNHTGVVVYLFQLAPVLYLLLAMLVTFLGLKVIAADAITPQINADKPLLRHNNFWKFCFYANLYLSLSLVLMFFVFPAVATAHINFYPNYSFDYWMLVTAGTLIASCITAALLLSTSVLWQGNRLGCGTILPAQYV